MRYRIRFQYCTWTEAPDKESAYKQGIKIIKENPAAVIRSVESESSIHKPLWRQLLG